MTLQEARQQVDACERQITGTYSNLLAAARSMGSSAVQAASSKTTASTMLPLIILSLFGLILCIASHPFWGIVLIIGGIAIAYKTNQSVGSVQTAVENQQKNLNMLLDIDSKI